MRRVVIPPSPGLFSAFGLLYADLEHHYSRTLRRVTQQADPAEIAAAWSELEAQARAQLATDGVPAPAMQIRRSAALHYKGQSFELVVPAPNGPIDRAFLDHIADAFGAEHERVYGHRAGPEEPVELVSIQLVAASTAETGGVPDRLVPSRPEPDPGPPRRVFFGSEHGWQETPILRRSDLAGGRNGPLIVEEYDATCVVPPGAKATIDAGGNIAIDLA